MFETWEALYKSQAQGVWALLVLPVLFLGWIGTRRTPAGAGVEPAAARFVRTWAVLFALLAILDPIATGLLGWPLLPFVLLGDYRVFVLALVVMQPGRPRPGALLEAAAWTLVVPALAYGVYNGIAGVRGEVPEMLLWLVYEIAFVVLVLVWWTLVVPARVPASRPATRRWVHGVLTVVAAYYVLWALADVVILAGRDWGWALRIVPNQLYYGVLVPAAYVLFFAAPNASARTSTHAAR